MIIIAQLCSLLFRTVIYKDFTYIINLSIWNTVGGQVIKILYFHLLPHSTNLKPREMEELKNIEHRYDDKWNVGKWEICGGKISNKSLKEVKKLTFFVR